MEIQEHRVRRLQELRDKKFGGQNAALGRALGYKTGAFVRQMLARERPITEKTVVTVHDIDGCAGWMDLPVGSDLIATPSIRAAEPDPPAMPLDWRTTAILMARQQKDAELRLFLIEFLREVDQAVAESAQNSPTRAKLATP